jgi:hypothetical protein
MNSNLNSGTLLAVNATTPNSSSSSNKATREHKHVMRHSMFVGSPLDDDDTNISNTSLNTLLTTAFAAQLARLNRAESITNNSSSSSSSNTNVMSSSKYNFLYKSHCDLALPPTKIPVKINNYNMSNRSPPPQLST